MSNSTHYKLRLLHRDKPTLVRVKQFLSERERQWEDELKHLAWRSPEALSEFCKSSGKSLRDVLTLGYLALGSVRATASGFSLSLSIERGERPWDELWVAGPQGQLAHLLDKFPGLQINGTFSDEPGHGTIEGWEKLRAGSQRLYTQNHNWFMDNHPEFANLFCDLALAEGTPEELLALEQAFKPHREAFARRLDQLKQRSPAAPANPRALKRSAAP